jgi:hypothetical protein
MANGHGGARNGAGRKPNGANVKNGATAVKAASEGVTPIEVMLEAMRSHYDADELDRAAEIAAKAAPYCHPRLAAVEVGGAVEVEVIVKRVGGRLSLKDLQ